MLVDRSGKLRPSKNSVKSGPSRTTAIGKRRATTARPSAPVVIPRPSRLHSGSRNLFANRDCRIFRSDGREAHPVCPPVRPLPRRTSLRTDSREAASRACRSASPVRRPDCRDAVHLRKPRHRNKPHHRSRVSSALPSTRRGSILRPSILRRSRRRISVRPSSRNRMLRTGFRSVVPEPHRVWPAGLHPVRKVQRPRGFRAAGPERPPACRRGPRARRSLRPLYCRVRPPSRRRVLPTVDRSRRRATHRTLLVIATGPTRRRQRRSSSPGRTRVGCGRNPHRTRRSSPT